MCPQTPLDGMQPAAMHCARLSLQPFLYVIFFQFVTSKELTYDWTTEFLMQRCDLGDIPIIFFPDRLASIAL